MDCIFPECWHGVLRHQRVLPDPWFDAGAYTATLKRALPTRAKKFYLGAIDLDDADYRERAMLTKVTAVTGSLTA